MGDMWHEEAVKEYLKSVSALETAGQNVWICRRTELDLTELGVLFVHSRLTTAGDKEYWFKNI